MKGRPKTYGVGKKEHKVTLTDEAWKGAKAVIKAAGYSSVSQFLEELGRGNAGTITPRQPDKLE